MKTNALENKVFLSSKAILKYKKIRKDFAKMCF